MGKSNNQETYWVNLSDIMTGLMVIFLFIAITYIMQQKKEEREKDKLVEQFQNTKIELYKKLKKEFESDFQPSRWNAVLEEDLSIRFLNDSVLFGYNEDVLKPEFKFILNDFFPRYMAILLKDTFRNSILEVRIEGHTDSIGDYMYNIGLSQRRTKNVLEHVMNGEKSNYRNLSEADKTLVRYWLMANGLSYGRTLDNQGDLTIGSGKPVNIMKSRRVEFRIVTKTDQVLQELLDKIADKK
jgi:outer membrane protein OmpA-like peptidoglycan-associated protein